MFYDSRKLSVDFVLDDKRLLLFAKQHYIIYKVKLIRKCFNMHNYEHLRHNYAVVMKLNSRFYMTAWNLRCEFRY